MNEEFWLERWKERKTGFHQHEVNAHLRGFWPRLGLAPGERVFVPLCGKSRDMIWLRERGHRVLGIELSPLAVAAFFAENDLTPTRTRQGGFDVWETPDLRILCGNFFDLAAADLVGVRAVYDRAALVALPPEMRERYASHMSEIVEAGTRMLLLTLDYPQAEMEGPPFSVSPDEVDRLYGIRGDVDMVARDSVLAEEPSLAERGLSALHACAFLVSMGARKA
jgi:thiopurine S-methyltransferase